MNTFENPIEFDVRKEICEKKIEYSNLREISQGGPVIGTISINGTSILDHQFGGPILCEDEYLYAPVFIQKFLGYGFKLGKVNTNTLTVEKIGKTQDLIFLDRLESNRVYYFVDLNRISSQYYEI